jgi:hypothetical protein
MIPMIVRPKDAIVEPVKIVERASFKGIPFKSRDPSTERAEPIANEQIKITVLIIKIARMDLNKRFKYLQVSQFCV